MLSREGPMQAHEAHEGIRMLDVALLYTILYITIETHRKEAQLCVIDCAIYAPFTSLIARTVLCAS